MHLKVWGPLISSSIFMAHAMIFWPLTLKQHSLQKVQRDALRSLPKYQIKQSDKASIIIQ